MKDFHSPSPTPGRCVNLLPSNAGPAWGGESPRSDPNRGFPRGTRGAVGGWGEKGMDGTGNAPSGNVGGNLHSFRQVVESHRGQSHGGDGAT